MILTFLYLSIFMFERLRCRKGEEYVKGTTWDFGGL